jgi:hypothetical protein
MFSKVVADAKEYTRPVVILYRFTDGRVESNIGTFFHVDDCGHILSASHIFKMGSEDPISSISIIFSGRYFKADYIADDIQNDIVLLKITDYVPGSIKIFPKFLKGSIGELPQGTPLVRLGYPKGEPHSNIPIAWDEANQGFALDETQIKITCFHNDGIVTQYVDRDKDVRLLEMSTPALMGQSGGPVLSAEGTVVGLQSRNTVLEIPAEQPLETGLAASHIVIAKFLEPYPAVRVAWI